MPKRLKKVPKKKTGLVTPFERLQKVLAKCKKGELIDVIVGFAKADRSLMRQLQMQFDVESSPEELVNSTSIAISDATDFDERFMNHNFDYDSESYSMIEKNFTKLIKAGHLREVMKLSLELMRQGSHQVECSDEGMMTYEIEDCLKIVIKALCKSDLPVDDIISWCVEIEEKDRVGFICDKEIQALKVKMEAS